MNKSKCIVFDLDGTLADTASDIALAVNMTRAVFGLDELDVDTVKSFVGDGVTVLLERAFAGTHVNAADAAEIMRDCYLKSLNMTSKLYPDVFETIKNFRKKGWKTALFSNKPDEFCKYIICDVGLGNDFDLVIGASDAFPRKPDPEALFCIMEILGISDPASSWMVGDSANDIKAGKSAGMKTAFATYGYGSAENLEADLVFNSFKELERSLNE